VTSSQADPGDCRRCIGGPFQPRYIHTGRNNLVDLIEKLIAESNFGSSEQIIELLQAMLIRPDACIAWADEENSTNGLEEALRCWFSPVIQHLEPANWNEVITRPYGGG
jgi:hypothetical protein